MDENICRICFTSEIQLPLVPINLRRNGLSPKEKLSKFNLKIEGGPSSICSQCIRELDNAINFIDKCEKSNQKIAIRLKNNSPLWRSIERSFNTKDKELEAIESVDKISDAPSVKADAVLVPTLKSQCPHCGSQRRCKHWAPSTIHTCPYCSKEFNRRFNFNVHVKRHLGDNRWPCPTCGANQLTRWLAQRHCRPRPRRTCPHPNCGRTFTTATNLNNHIRTHTGERPYACEECGKSFTSKNTLTVHLRIHTGEKPYMCPVCGKRFANNKLSEHLASHAGAVHSCPVGNCDKTFRSARTAQLHVRTHGPAARGAHACAQCGARYSHAQSLRKHERRQHPSIQRPEDTSHACHNK